MHVFVVYLQGHSSVAIPPKSPTGASSRGSPSKNDPATHRHSCLRPAERLTASLRTRKPCSPKAKHGARRLFSYCRNGPEFWQPSPSPEGLGTGPAYRGGCCNAAVAAKCRRVLREHAGTGRSAARCQTRSDQGGRTAPGSRVDSSGTPAAGRREDSGGQGRRPRGRRHDPAAGGTIQRQRR
jgi:hypothetical protein